MCNLRFPFCYTCLHLKNPLAVLVKLSLWRLMQDVLRQAIHVSFCRRRQLSWNEGVQRLSELKCQSWSWNQIVNILSGLWTRCIHIWPDHTCMGVSVQSIIQLIDDKDSSFPSEIRIRIVSVPPTIIRSPSIRLLGFANLWLTGCFTCRVQRLPTVREDLTGHIAKLQNMFAKFSLWGGIQQRMQQVFPTCNSWIIEGWPVQDLIRVSFQFPRKIGSIPFGCIECITAVIVPFRRFLGHFCTVHKCGDSPQCEWAMLIEHIWVLTFTAWLNDY